jgi:hypothetical protein
MFLECLEGAGERERWINRQGAKSAKFARLSFGAAVDRLERARS